MSGAEPGGTEEVDEREAWRRLSAHLSWSEGSTLSFVFSSDRRGVSRLRERAFEEVEADGGKTRLLSPADPQELREVVRELVSGRGVALLWLEALGEEPEWLDAWDDVLQRLNERREQLRRSLGGALVFACAPALKARVRNRAPDLWSIRSVATDLAPSDPPEAGDPQSETGDPAADRTAPGAPDRRAQRSNAYRIAEAVLRFEFHQRTRSGPWFALVVGDDPAPRRRLLDALLERGVTALVHGQSSAALLEPTSMDFHWVLAGDEPQIGLVGTLGGEGPPASRPVVIEGSLRLESALSRHLPDLYASVGFVVRLHVERTLHPGPLPVLDGTEQLVHDVWEALERARALEGDLDGLTGREVSRARVERIRELIRAAEALLRQGWAHEAVPLARDILRAVAELPPQHPHVALLTADGEELAGRIARHQGDPGEAASRYAASLPLRRKLANSRGVHRLRRRAELARCLSILGELGLATGPIDEAEAALRESLAIRRRLARATDDRSTLSELATAWSMLGDLELARHEAGDRRLEAATDAYREALRLRERIAAEEDAPRFRRLLSVACGRLARVCARTGDWVASRQAAERSVELARELCREDPGNPTWRIDLSVALGRLGDAARATGDLATAADAYASAVELRTRLLADDPENPRCQELLGLALGRLAEARLAQGDPGAALPHSVRETELSEQLGFLDPGHIGWQRALGEAWIRRGDVARALERHDEAQLAYRRALSAAFALAGSSFGEGARRARELVRALDARGVPDEQLALLRARCARGD